MAREFRMTKFRWAIVIILWCILVSCPLFYSNSKQKRLPAIRVDKATKADITAFVSGPAEIEPRVNVDVSANIMGKVTKIYVKEGERVAKGDTLLELEQTQYRAGRDEAWAAYRTTVRNVDLAETKWETAKDVFARKQELYAQKLISKEQFDIAKTQYEAERTEYEVARDTVARARAALVQAKDSLDKTVYTAPLDGVVTALNVEEGEFTVVGTLNTPGTVMLTVADLAAMQATADIDETDVVQVKLGQPASVTIDAFPDEVFRGEVIEVASSAKEDIMATTDKTSADYEVKVLLGGDTGKLRPGMSATVDVVTAEVKKAPAIPIQALVTRDRRTVEEWKNSGKKKARAPDKPVGAEDAPSSSLFRADYVKGVFVLEDEQPLVKRARFVRVEAGIAGEYYVEIKKGLKGDETIIVGPYKTLRTLADGDIVRIDTGRENGKE
jgi:HlyD family secretion protein